SRKSGVPRPRSKRRDGQRFSRSAPPRTWLPRPGKTIGDTFRGVGHIFGAADASMHATNPRQASLLASVTGGAMARRKLAFELGVDPYTSFPPLEEQLKRLATANALGQTGANAGLAFVTGGAGIAISAGGTSDALRENLRDKSPADLEKDG